LTRYQLLETGSLADAEEAALLEHLERCGSCAQRLNTLAEQETLVELIRRARARGDRAADEVVGRLVERLSKLRPAEAAAADGTVPPREPSRPPQLVFACPSCGKRLKVKGELAGKAVKCPHCQQTLRIPAPSPGALTHAAPAATGTVSLDPLSLSAPSTVGGGEAASGAIEPRAGQFQPARSANREQYDFLTPARVPDELGRLGPYRVLQVLGAGGMGVVFRAEDPQLARLVALKAMLPALAISETARERFLREARATAAIKHDHIVTIYQVGEDHDVPFLAMEFLEGESLDVRLKREGKLPVADVLRIGREIALGLEAAHKRELIHRDIKPANIWLEAETGRVKILDFGLVRAVGQENQLTQQGDIVGTPAYMAPEQAQGQSVDHRSDLFSLGGVLYRMATGEPAFRGTTMVSTLLAVTTANPRPPHELEPGLPRPLSTLIVSLLAKQPDERPPSARAVADALQELEEHVKTERGPAGPKAAPRPSRLDKKGPPWRRAALIGGGVGVALLFLVVLWAAGVFRVKTKDGTIVLANLPPDADVTIDDKTVELRTVDGKTVAISIAPGKKQRLQVKKNGVTLLGEDVQIDAGGERTITLRYEPPAPGTGGAPVPDKDSLDRWFAVGTRWEGKVIRADINPIVERSAWFIVTSREGNTFRGRFVNEGRLDLTVEGSLSDDHQSFTSRVVDQVMNDWQAERVPVEFVEGSEKFKDGRVRIDWKAPGTAAHGYCEFTARKTISRPAESDKWPPALHPGKGYCGPGGKWRVVGAELVQEEVVKDPNSQPWINFGDYAWAEYDFRLKAMKTGGENGFGIAFDLLYSPNRFMEWGIGINRNRDSCVQTCEKLPDRVQVTRRTEIIPVTIKNNQWYDVLVRIRGKQIECFLEGRRQFQFTYPDHRGGLVALNCWHMSARFKDIEIKAPDGKILWKGPPELSP
jgi:hypothetical protein